MYDHLNSGILNGGREGPGLNMGREPLLFPVPVPFAAIDDGRPFILLASNKK